jgi:hypothetical protein
MATPPRAGIGGAGSVLPFSADALAAARSRLATPVSCASAAASTPGSGGRASTSSLLDEIRSGGKTLRPAAAREAPLPATCELPSIAGMSEPGRQTLASTLAAAMAQRRRDLQQRKDDDDDDDADADGWDD